MYCLFLFSCGAHSKERNNSEAVHVQPYESANSYNADTFYSNLKYGLVDMSASRNIEELLCQGWIQEDDKTSLDNATEGGEIELAIRSYHFFSDHSFLRNIFQHIESGRWVYNDADKTIKTIYDDGGGGDNFKIRAIAADELKLTDTDVGRNEVVTYVADGKRWRNKMNDPFYIANQQWQIKPIHKETDAEIQKRLKAYLHFFELFYKDKIAREAPTVSFYGFPAIINWHASGMSLKMRSDLSDRWKNCFYNNEQANRAYTLLQNVLKKDYSFPKENINWIKKNLYLLQQVIENMNRLN